MLDIAKQLLLDNPLLFLVLIIAAVLIFKVGRMLMKVVLVLLVIGIVAKWMGVI